VFNEFDDAGTYQVNISLIENLTDLKMPNAIDAYNDNRSQKLVMKKIEVSPKPRTSSTKVSLGFSISNIVL
jgi:endonuclease G